MIQERDKSPQPRKYTMDDFEYDYDEGSDIDNWEDEQVFQDHEGREDDDLGGSDAFEDWRDEDQHVEPDASDLYYDEEDGHTE